MVTLWPSNTYWKRMTSAVYLCKKSNLQFILNRILQNQDNKKLYDVIILISPAEHQDWAEFLKREGLDYSITRPSSSLSNFDLYFLTIQNVKL
jgi:hypothetical protein